MVFKNYLIFKDFILIKRIILKIMQFVFGDKLKRPTDQKL